MTTVRLHAGTVTTAGSAPGSLVGSGVVWDDGSDSTYLDTSAVQGSGVVFAGIASLDHLSLPSGAAVSAVTINVRAMGVTGTDTPPRINAEVNNFAESGSFQLGVNRDPADSSFSAWEVPTTGTPSDMSHTFGTDDFDGYGVSLAALVSALTSGLDVTVWALTVPGHASGSTVHCQVFEVSVDVTYGGVVETPCDTDMALDLSTAVFLTAPDSDSDPGPFGQYSDSVIWPLPDPGGGADYYPDFTLGLTLDAVKKFRVTIAFDPDSAHDSGGRSVLLLGIPSGQSTVPTGPPTFYDGTGNTDDTVTITIGPGIGDWDDPTNGVAAGWDGLWFETSNAGAVSAITIRKVCTTFAPPQRLTNRDDMFASARRLTGSRSRQGSNRLTGYL